MRVWRDAAALSFMIAFSVHGAAGQAEPYVPSPIGSSIVMGVLQPHSNGITVYVCNQASPTSPTCPFTSVATVGMITGAVDAYAGTGIDLTVIDEVRGDNITNGEDIFSKGVNLHFIGASGGQTSTNPTTPFIIDFPIHVGPQESVRPRAGTAGF